MRTRTKVEIHSALGPGLPAAIVLVAAVAGAGAQEAGGPADPCRAAPPSPPSEPTRAKPDAAGFESAGDLLDAIERGDAGIDALSAGIQYIKTFSLAGDRQERRGALYYRVRKRGSPEGSGSNEPDERAFAIRFDELRTGDRIEPISKVYVFDGRYLVEKLPEQKLFTKRQIVPEGESFDPLRIGEGPFPVPIGQRRDDIEARYTTDMRPVDEQLPEAFARWAGDAVQIRLVPREFWAPEDDFTEIRLWYRPDDEGRLLPWVARTMNKAGDEAIVRLIGIRLNDGARIPEDAFDTQPPDEGWDVQILPAG